MDWDPLLDPRPFQGSWIGEIPGEREGEPQAPLGGTRYAPPESLPDSIFSPVSGVWSFGAGLCELFFACGRASQQKRPRNPPPAMAEGNHKRLPLQPDDAPFRPLL
ncbi:uncharacterized protein LOC121917103 isoform X4 [Sceloporus undulatus]|uniref:uncharacterized protein LOC121917103 isoform X4 n=1 Tax=Sceloporus undulatus TaxID=8520 RepID=UPI001C4D723E|nr:uncharacterized protein LOC121917103 isoform X4 [Sceloporus undulatus]